MKANFSVLPKNVVQNICLFLDDKKDLHAFGKVNKKINKWVFSDENSWLIWKRFYPRIELIKDNKKTITKQLKQINLQKKLLIQIAKEYKKAENKQDVCQKWNFAGKFIANSILSVWNFFDMIQGKPHFDKLIESTKKCFNKEDVLDLEKINKIFAKESHNKHFVSENPWKNSALMEIYRKKPLLLELPVYGYKLTPLALACRSAALLASCAPEDPRNKVFLEIIKNLISCGAKFDAKSFSNFKFEELPPNFLKTLLKEFSDHISDDWVLLACKKIILFCGVNDGVLVNENVSFSCLKGLNNHVVNDSLKELLNLLENSGKNEEIKSLLKFTIENFIWVRGLFEGVPIEVDSEFLNCALFLSKIHGPENISNDTLQFLKEKLKKD